MRIWILLIACGLFCLQANAETPRLNYDVHPLGQATNLILNDKGQIIATVPTAESTLAYIHFQPRGKNPRILHVVDHLTGITDMNNRGQIVGKYQVMRGHGANQSIEGHGFLAKFGTKKFQDITPNEVSVTPVALSNSGHIAGNWRDKDGNDRVFTWYASRGLAFIPNANWAGDINDYGDVAWNQRGYGFVRYADTQEVTGISASGGTNAIFALNNRGDFVGQYNSVAFRQLRDGTFDSLGALPGDGFGSSTALDINDRGDVVGSSRDRAFVYTGVHGMVDLNSTATFPNGITLYQAIQINKYGEIAAIGRKNNQFYGFLLRPRRHR